MMGLVLVLSPFLLVIERFLPKPKRGAMWRAVGAYSCRMALSAAGVKVKVLGKKNIPDKAVIYAANHSCLYDGFVLLAILGPRITHFTAPPGVFPRSVAFWLRKMQAVNVRRDRIDDRKHPRGNSKKEAIKQAAETLKRGVSLIIFPEGHIEYLRVLHYFHTGTMRISGRAGVDVVPVVIVNGPECFPDRQHVTAGTVTVEFGSSIKAPKRVSDRPTIRKCRDQLEKRIVDMLPQRYLPTYYHAHKPRSIGVFVDIDRTIYEGFSQTDLMKFLLKMHRIHHQDVFRAFYWLFLEKMGQASHRKVMEEEYMILHGWDVEDVNRLAHKIFDEDLIKKIQAKLYSRLYDHAKAGHTVVLVSEVMHPLAREFKRLLSAKASLDTKLQQTVKHGHRKYTGKVSCLCYGQTKANLVQKFADEHGINLGRSYGYADSHGDIPFLQLTKYPVVLNPDEKLAAHATAHHWKCLETRE